jgi:hypothetical protein
MPHPITPRTKDKPAKLYAEFRKGISLPCHLLRGRRRSLLRVSGLATLRTPYTSHSQPPPRVARVSPLASVSPHSNN